MNKSELEQYNKIEKTCKLCGKKFYTNWSKYVLSEFCCRSCSRKYSSRIKRDDANKKISESLKRNDCSKRRSQKVRDDYYKNPKKCIVCGKVIDYEKKKNKTCSHKCHYISANKTKKENNTVFIENGQGRSISGYYKGFFCGSTYELVYYIYMTEHGQNVERNNKRYDYVYDGKNRVYIPDFRVNGNLVEIKGYYTKQVQEKINSVKDESITVLYYDDLEHMMCYVDKKYGTSHSKKSNNYFVLYDTVKPSYRYEYICSICGKKFKTNTYRNHKKYKHIVCSKECRKTLY